MFARLNPTGPEGDTIMNRSRGTTLTIPSLAITLLFSVAARAQGPAAMGGGASYMPLAGGFGGFVPYRPGPNGGLGVIARPDRPPARPATGAMLMGGGRRDLGRVRTLLTPFSPANGRSAGMAGSLFRRPSTLGMGRMNGRTRAAVGSFPFREPPSFGDQAASPAGMSM